MSRYFTSDLHLGSSSINKYAHRPFASGKEAIDKLIANCNDVAQSKLDTLIHVGDFALDGVDRHDGEDESCLGCDVRELPLFFNSRLVLLAGNHDDGHNFEADAKSLTLDLNQNYRNVYVSHYPSTHPHYRGPDCSHWRYGRGIVLCGHIHDKWLLSYDQKKNILNVNVGVDVWGYRPVRDSEITDMLDFISSYGEIVFSSKDPDRGSWTRDRLEKWTLKVKHDLAEAREQRRKEKLEKKGLTPEDCERRRIEAMKAKGLIK